MLYGEILYFINVYMHILQVTWTIEGTTINWWKEENFTTQNFGVSVHSDTGYFPSIPEIEQTYWFIKGTISATLNWKPS